MCPVTEHPDQLPLPLGPSVNGSTASPGPIGEPSPLERLGARLARHHKGLSTISLGISTVQRECPGTFSALRKGGLEGYTVTLSCDLTSSQYADLIATLERNVTLDGGGVTVDVEFEPMTPNLVPPTTAPST